MTADSPLLSWQAARGGGFFVLRGLILLAGWVGVIPPAAAQMRPVAIQDATLITGTGDVVTRGTLVLQDGKITALGTDVKPPFLSRRIPAAGKYVTPGLIDVWSTLALRWEPALGQPLAQAADAFDRYAEYELRAAWSAGITAAYLPARAASGFSGLGAVVRLVPPGASDGVVAKPEAALCAALGVVEGEGPLARVKIMEEMQRRFQAAKDYREACNDYEDALKEYELKLAERAKAGTVSASKPAVGKPTGNKAAESKKSDDGEEKKDELKKPAQPENDRVAKALLRVIDGDLRFRVTAQSPADILNAVELADQFNLALVIEGGAGAALVADELARHQVPVVLTAAPPPMAFTGGVEREARADTPAALQEAGVPVYFGSGVLPTPDAAPNLALRVASAIGHGFRADDALAAITSRAARFLGLEKELGRLEPGLRADVVVWSAHPLSPGARVEIVFVGGREVYRADRAPPEQEQAE